MKSEITEVFGYFSEEQANAMEQAFGDGDDDLVRKLLGDFAANPAFSDEEIKAMQVTPYIEICARCECSGGSNVGTKSCQKWHPKCPPPADPTDHPLYMGSVRIVSCRCLNTTWARLKFWMRPWM